MFLMTEFEEPALFITETDRSNILEIIKSIRIQTDEESASDKSTGNDESKINQD